MKPLDRFLYWIHERHQIYLRKQAGEPKPWTNDVVLQRYYFTNPYRENDKTTVWFREHLRGFLQHTPQILFQTVAFRWFNLISTGQRLKQMTRRTNTRDNLLETWDENLAVKLLREINKTQPVFTGAFMVKVANGPPGCKIPQVCECITEVWKQRKRLVQVCHDDCRLEALWQELKKFRGLGGFLSYEIVCDLRYTDLLRKATDVNTFCNIGPGASRGLNRLAGRPIVMAKGGTKDSGRKPPYGWQQQMRKLLAVVKLRLPNMPKFEMREVEHSLCEYDKYERLLFNEGKSKRRYNGCA